MGSHTGTEFNDLAKLLFRSINTVNPNFNPLEYLDKFEGMKTNLDKVNFVYEDVKKYPTVFAKFMKDEKDDSLASQHIDNGKRKFNSGKYWEALEDFTRSVSTAQNETALALAYGHRSECFFKLEMPDKCIEDIERALPYYPKELVENLTERRKQAENMQPLVSTYFENISENSEKDSFIKIAYNNEAEKYIMATRDIEVGEIISTERPFTTVLTADRLTHCHECLKLCYNPLPCNSCTVALFCSELCKTKARAYHKYECPILLTLCYRVLCEFATDSTILLALKITLLVEKCYPQKQMIERRESNFYTDRFSEAHFLQSKATFSRFDVFHQAILTALVFELLWNYTSFFSGIFCNSESKDKFKEIMLLQLQTSCINAAHIYEYAYKGDFCGTSNFGLGAYSHFSLYSHSCCANVMKAFHGNIMVLRALNSIKEGEQCFVNRYGLRYDVSSYFDRQQFLFIHKLPKCVCKACEENWPANLGDLQEMCGKLNIDVMQLGDIVRDVVGSDAHKAVQFLPQMIAQLKECEHLEPDGNALAWKSLIAHCYVIFGNKKIQSDKIKRDIVLAP